MFYVCLVSVSDVSEQILGNIPSAVPGHMVSHKVRKTKNVHQRLVFV